MKVLVLGGAGNMGGIGTKILQYFPGIDSVTIADRDLEAAENLVKTLNFPKVNAVELDATDTKRVTELARNFDVVFNTVGPYTKFGIPILEAVMAAGVDYVDVCDDSDATEDMLELHEKAQEAGITALIGMGQSPGITNIQAKYLADKLDQVDSIKVVWGADAPDPEVAVGTPFEEIAKEMSTINSDLERFKKNTPTGWDHMIHSASGEIPIWKDGKFDTIPAWDSGEYVDFAEPLGRIDAYYVGHSEPVTLPRYIDIKDFCACLGRLHPTMNKAIRLEARGHEEPLTPLKEPTTPQWETPEKLKELGVWCGNTIIVEGLKDGKKVRYTNRASGSIFDKGVFNFGGQATGVYLMGVMKEKPKGVFAPEGLIDPEVFFKEYVRISNEVNGWDFTFEELLPTEYEVLS